MAPKDAEVPREHSHRGFTIFNPSIGGEFLPAWMGVKSNAQLTLEALHQESQTIENLPDRTRPPPKGTPAKSESKSASKSEQSSAVAESQQNEAGPSTKKAIAGPSTKDTAESVFKVAERPRILLMGQRRSGKSSIASVVFHKMPPNETLFLETTTKISKESVQSFMEFQVWDFPAQVDYNSIMDVGSIFGNVGALIWVLDSQDEYFDAIEKLNETILFLRGRFPAVNVEVFIHKVDSLSDDYKDDLFRDIQQRVLDEMADHNYELAPLSFYQTSIYDHSIYEAISKVIQKLVPQLPTLESLLNMLCSNSKIEKAYLIDIQSKIYIASDTSPGDITQYEICADYIDIICDLSAIWGWERPEEGGAQKEEYGNEEAESLISMEKSGVGYLYLREMNKYLALVCIMGEDDPAKNKAKVDYNVNVFQKALNQVLGQK